jgi:hypothetical protein
MTDHEAALAPLSAVIARHKHIEGFVLWHKDGAWSDANGESLDAEEIVFYAEGLLMEGFGMAWQHLSDPALGDHIRLYFWQGAATHLPPPGPGVVRLAGG